MQPDVRKTYSMMHSNTPTKRIVKPRWSGFSSLRGIASSRDEQAGSICHFFGFIDEIIDATKTRVLRYDIIGLEKRAWKLFKLQHAIDMEQQRH